MLKKIFRFLTGKEEKKTDSTQVIFDILFEEGLLFALVRNTGDKPVFKVAVQFDRKIFGLEGTKEISALPLFKNIEFLAPQREIKTFLDTSSSYFQRGEPTRIAVRISYQDFLGRRCSAVIRHDLEIYRTIGYVGHPLSG